MARSGAARGRARPGRGPYAAVPGHRPAARSPHPPDPRADARPLRFAHRRPAPSVERGSRVSGGGYDRVAGHPAFQSLARRPPPRDGPSGSPVAAWPPTTPLVRRGICGVRRRRVGPPRRARAQLANRARRANGSRGHGPRAAVRRSRRANGVCPRDHGRAASEPVGWCAGPDAADQPAGGAAGSTPRCSSRRASARGDARRSGRATLRRATACCRGPAPWGCSGRCWRCCWCRSWESGGAGTAPAERGSMRGGRCPRTRAQLLDEPCIAR